MFEPSLIPLDNCTITANSWILYNFFRAQAIERIGDHAKNMPEYLVYMVKGWDMAETIEWKTRDEITT